MLPTSQIRGDTMQRWRGFTLIELMIVVLTAAVLMAIAYPSYTKYVVRGHVAAGQAYLMDAAQREQQYLLDNRDYADTGTITTIDPPQETVLTDYTITADTTTCAPRPCFVLKAAPLPGGLVAQHGGTYNQSLTITSTGQKSSSGSPKLW